MSRRRTYSQIDLQRAIDHIDSLPSLKVMKFKDRVSDSSPTEQSNSAVHDDELTLSGLRVFLESHGFDMTIDDLRRLRRVAGVQDTSESLDAENPAHID